MDRLVHIVMSDRGWILERLAKEIASRVPYVTFDTVVDKAAPIQYYITYGCRRERVSSVELALFTHQENDPATAERFLAVARAVDAAVAMSKATGRILADAGIANTVISPGVDLERFTPKLKIAVVGRTYHTGRKGEALVNAVMDIPDIEWHFTGEGWPGPALKIDEADLPAFYRSMDYVLVPALNEGGPMCVLEALASGVPVIGAATGWVPDFPHIPFEAGDPQSLRAVLCGLRDRKFALRAAVSGMTWDRWAADHDELFRTLAARHGLLPTSAPVSLRRVRSAALVSHGLESTVIGGPSVRIPRTVEALRRVDVEAAALRYPSAGLSRYDLVHAYNVWPPISAVRIARRAAELGKPFVFSPIMLDLSEAPLWQGDVLRAFRNATSPEHAEALMGWARSRQAQRAAAGTQPEPEPGYLDALRELAETADAFVFLGERERDLTARLLPALPEVSRIVRNPVDAALFSSGDPALFRSAYGLTDYVLCVARIEHRKNQLLLALALRDTGIPLVLIGHPGDEEYLRLVKSFGGPNLVIIDRLEPGSPMLRSAIAGARVFTLPSWAEGAPLAALEAGAAGARMVLSDRSSEREYFGDLALYCDPADPASIRQAVLAAWDAPWTADDRATLVRHVAQSFSWDRHVVAATSVYEEVAHRRAGGILPPALRRRTPAAPALPVPAGTAGPFEIVFDLTTSANNAGTRSGIVRVERSLCECLLARKDVRVRLVVWRSAEAGFVEIPPSIVARGLLHSYLQSTPPAPVQHGALRPGSRFLVVGSSWMQNAAYSHSLSTFTVEHGLELSILMHDLTPVLFPHWFLEGYSGRFTQNLAILLQTADRLLAYSDNTRSDLQDLALEMDLDLCPIEKFRLADAIGAFALEMSDTGRQIQAKFSRLPFILATGGIHARKNYGLLYDVWSMLRQRMGDRCPHLVIAGGVLWNGAETARTIREDRLVNRHIHILDDVDDAALDWLYRNCLFTVYPSLYEGWGLPVGESLSYGKVCVASNRSSVPEIAPTLTDLLDPLDRQVWASVIQHYATSKSAREAKEARIRAEYVPTAWEDSAAGVLTALSVPQAAPRRDLYTLGDLVLLGAEDAVPRHRRSGWYPRESWGAWTSSGTARLRLVLTAEPDEDLVFSLVFKYFTPLDKPNRCTVVANGTKVAEWDVRLTAQKDAWPFTASQALIPKHLVGADRRVEIELISTSRHKVSDVVPSSQDQRLLGLGVTGFCLHKASAMPNLLTLLGTRADVRNALGAPPAQDLARRFRSNAARPVYPVNQCWPAAPAEGAAYLADPALSRPEGFQSRSGSLWLRGGTVDLDLHRDAILEAVVVASVPEGGRVRISVLVNSELAGDWDIADGSPTALSMVLPRAALAKQDPAEIVLVSDAATGGLKPGAGEFVVAQMALRQPAPDVLRAVPSLAAGQTVELSDKNPAVTQAFLTQGWYPAEEFGVWSIGDLGRLGATVDPHAAGNAVLALEVQALASGKPDDTATVAVEGTRIAATIDVAAPGVGLVSQTVFLNLSALTQGQEARIAFKRNAVVSPAVLGLSPDARVLGLQVSRMSLIALQPMPENAFIPASGEELDRFVLQDGWHGADDFGRWTDRRRGDLWFRVPPGVPAGVRLMLHLTAIAPDAGTGATVEVLINDRMVETRSVPHMDVQVVVVDLHDGLLAGNDLVKLSLVRDNPVVPQEIGMNGDGRCLGVLLTGMELQHTDAAARTMEGAVPVVSP